MSEQCPLCGGTGIHDGEECDMCDGTGFFYRNIPSMIFPSYSILECIDITEHGSLTDAQKNGVLYILACGFVDLNEGRVGRVRLWNWFGEESTTVANLTELIT